MDKITKALGLRDNRFALKGLIYNRPQNSRRDSGRMVNADRKRARTEVSHRARFLFWLHRGEKRRPPVGRGGGRPQRVRRGGRCGGGGPAPPIPTCFNQFLLGTQVSWGSFYTRTRRRVICKPVGHAAGPAGVVLMGCSSRPGGQVRTRFRINSIPRRR